MERQFTRQAENALKLAKTTAKTCGHGYIGTEHLLAGLLKEPEGTAGKVLQEFNVEEEKLRELISSLVTPVQGNTAAAETKDPQYSPRARRIIEQAKEDAESMECLCGTEHLLLSLLKETDCVATRLLFTMGVNIQKLFAAILTAMGFDNDTIAEEFQYARNAGNKKVTSTPTLDQYSRDLTQLAAEGKLDPVIGRDKEITRLIQILSRRTKNNPCLTGEPGVGKTAIVEGLAQRIVMGMVPDTVKDKRLVVLDLSGMVAGSKYRGEFEERIKNVLQEVKEHQGILLFIDEIHTIIGAGGAEGALDASNILKPSLSRGEIQLIGATTLEEYRKYIEKDAALERRFQPITVEEPDEKQCEEILKGLRERYETHHHVQITDDALQAAVSLSARYISDRFLPDKAIDVIDEACAKVSLSGFKTPEHIYELEKVLGNYEAKMEEAILAGDLVEASRIRAEKEDAQKKIMQTKKRFRKKQAGRKPLVTEEEVAAVVSDWTKIPVQKLQESEGVRLQKLEQTLHKRVVGQEEAVTAVAKAVRRGRVGLKDPKRPIGSFLFLGPTGVGKTELSKALSEALFHDENAMIRVDMSEYMEQHSVAKMIGSPPGYVGHEEGGQLSEQVRRHPYSVILFDEIEKAHPDVFNILLQVLDDGHITDSQGRKVDFRNTVIIMTSNAGAQAIIDPKRLGFGNKENQEEDYKRMKMNVMNEIKLVFRPEFLNRIDEILVFHPLGEPELKKITGMMCQEVVKRAKEQLDIHLTVRDSVKKLIMEKGTDKKYGARPLRRAVQSELEDSLAEAILAGEIKRGQEVVAGVSKKEIKFEVKTTK